MGYSTNETLMAYENLGREIGHAERQRMRLVLTLLMDDVQDSGSTSELIPEFARIANFVLANRKLTRLLNEHAESPFTEAEVVSIWQHGHR